MSKVRSTGNRSTELRLRMALVRHGVTGWQLHPRGIAGTPDFWFRREGVALFVDGCFWHGCPRCLRLPKGNRVYWSAKIAGNIARAKAIDAVLRQKGYAVMRIWEHRLKTPLQIRDVIGRIKLKILQHARSVS